MSRFFMIHVVLVFFYFLFFYFLISFILFFLKKKKIQKQWMFMYTGTYVPWVANETWSHDCVSLAT